MKQIDRIRMKIEKIAELNLELRKVREELLLTKCELEGYKEKYNTAISGMEEIKKILVACQLLEWKEKL